MTVVDLTGFISFIFGLLVMLLIIWIVSYTDRLARAQEEYKKSLSDSEYRKYTRYLQKINSSKFVFRIRGDK